MPPLPIAGTRDAELGALVHIAVGVTGNGDGLFPVFDHRLDAVDHNGCTEHSAVQHSADGAVGAFPHLMQLVFIHALGVGGDGGTLDRNAVLLVEGYVRLAYCIDTEKVKRSLPALEKLAAAYRK